MSKYFGTICGVTGILLFTLMLHTNAWATCGNINASEDGRVDLADITRLIDHIYVSKAPTACAPWDADINWNGDPNAEVDIDLADVTKIIDHVYLTKEPLSCRPTYEYNFKLCLRGGCGFQRPAPDPTNGSSAPLSYELQIAALGYDSYTMTLNAVNEFTLSLPVYVPVGIQATDIEIQYLEGQDDTAVSLRRHLQIDIPLTSDNYMPSSDLNMLQIYESMNKIYLFSDLRSYIPFPEQVRIEISAEYDPDPTDDIPVAYTVVNQSSTMRMVGNDLASNILYFYTPGNMVALGNPDTILYHLYLINDPANPDDDELLCTQSFSPDNSINSLFVGLPDEMGGACKLP